MWIGIPKTQYGFDIKIPTIPTIPRMFIFCAIVSVLFWIFSLPSVKHFIGSYVYLTKHDDTESDDKYYLSMIQSVLFSVLIFVLLKFYNPYKSSLSQTNSIITQTKKLNSPPITNQFTK